MLSIFVHVFHVIRYIDAKIDLPEFPLSLGILIPIVKL